MWIHYMTWRNNEMEGKSDEAFLFLWQISKQVQKVDD